MSNVTTLATHTGNRAAINAPKTSRPPFSIMLAESAKISMEQRLESHFPMVFRAGCGLTMSERRTIEGNIQGLVHYLSLPSSPEQIAQILAVLFNSMKTSTVCNNVDVMSASYHLVLEGLPYVVIKQAADDIIFGKADELSKTFMPSTAELRQYCEKIEGRARAFMSYGKGVLEAKENMPLKRVNPNQIKALMDAMGDAPASQTRH